MKRRRPLLVALGMVLLWYAAPALRLEGGRATRMWARPAVALLLVAAGAILWRSSEMERRLAAAERDLAMLRYEQAAAGARQPGGRLASLMPGAGRTTADARSLETTASYWRGNYEAVAENGDAKLLAAAAMAFDLGGLARLLVSVCLVGGLLALIVMLVRPSVATRQHTVSSSS